MKRFVLLFILAMLVYYGVRLHQLLGKGSGADMTVDPLLVELLNEWKKDMADNDIYYATTFNRLHKIIVVEDSLITGSKQGNVAYANMYEHNIKISKGIVERGRLVTKATLYHELGHYVFDLDHVDAYCLMHEYSHEEADLKKNWDYLLDMYLIRCKNHENYAKL